MTLRQFVVNAFARGHFTGNPAAVVPLDAWLPDDRLQAIAEQNNLAETAYVLPPDEAGVRALRWFTPAKEVRLCGHATLATAHALARELDDVAREYRFDTLSGELRVRLKGERYVMDFPADVPTEAPELRATVADALGPDTGIRAVLRGRDDVFAVVESAERVLAGPANLPAIRDLPARGLIVSAAAGEGQPNVDVVSRCFYPEYGIDEDPATGSAHTVIGAYWAETLGKPELRCLQASRRGGYIDTVYRGGDRIELAGAAMTFSRGEIEV